MPRFHLFLLLLRHAKQTPTLSHGAIDHPVRVGGPLGLLGLWHVGVGPVYRLAQDGIV